MFGWRFVRIFSFAALLAVVPFLTNCGCDPVDLGGRTTLDANPNSLSYDAVGGQKQVRTVILRAEGGVVGIQGISIKQGRPFYKIVGDIQFPKELDAGKTLSVQVEYNAPEGGAVQGLMEVEHDASAPANGKLEIRLLAKVNQPHLIFTPNPVTFDQVEKGKTKEITVTAENRSDAVMQIPEIKWIDETKSDAFKFPDGLPQAPKTLQPNEKFTFKVSYSPNLITGDRGKMTFSCAEKCVKDLYTLEFKGALAAPNIEVSPLKLDFGFVGVGKSKTLSLKITNRGKAELVIDQMATKVGSSGAFIVPPLTNIRIAGGKSREFGVQFRPVNGNDHKGTLEIKSNDPTRPLITIPLSGKVSSPDIEVAPKQINFGRVPLSATRAITIANAGNQELNISQIIFEQGTSNEFKIQQGIQFPIKLSPNQFKTVQVIYTPTNKGGDSGKLVVISNDPDEPRVTVTLQAEGSADKVCDLQPNPRKVNFGLSVLGKTKVIPVKWTNQGAVDCQVRQFDINLQSSFPPYTGPNPYVLTTPPAGCKKSAPGRFDCNPPLIVKPAQVIVTDIGFQPLQEKQATPLTSPSFDGWMDVLTNGTPPKRRVDLTGLATKACVSVVPDNLNLGLVTVNCSSQKEKITIFNTCPQNMSVTKIGFSVSGANGFRIVSAQQVPFVIPTGQSADVVVQYRSTAPPKKSAAVLEIEHSVTQQSPLSVPMVAEGTLKSDQTDNFQQSKNPKIDILFVVDDSGSMSDNQRDLGRNFKSFIQLAKTFNVDFQLGVTTTDTGGNNPFGGNKTPGELRGSPTIMTNSTPNLETIFQQNVNVGTNGSAKEAGLEAARLALSHPLATTGKNKGFLRKDASLAVIVVSDEPDQSPQAVQYYINFFRNIKGVRNVDQFRFSAVIGYDPVTKKNQCSKSGAGGSASASSQGRYLAVANATRGVAASICTDWAGTLRQLGALSFGLRSQFFLTRPADPTTVKVKVNGTAAPSTDWSYDAQTNSVVFKKPPAAGVTISVNYRAICF